MDDWTVMMMELNGMQCSGCGSANVVFDPRTRKMTCNQCGKQEYYSRATLNASGKVLYSRQNAIRYFTEGNVEMASRFAQEVLSVSLDNAGAVFIQAYYDDFVLGRSTSIRAFFRQMESMALEYEEIRDLMQLFLVSRGKLIDNEKDVLRTVAMNMQSDEDRKELSDFVDRFSAVLIGRRSSMTFLDPELAEIYQDLSAHCGIPKTCYALLDAIVKNPDSPYAANTFYLKEKVRYFYRNFVLPVGRIISSMQENPYRQKFIRAYDQRRAQYEKDAGIKEDKS